VRVSFTFPFKISKLSSSAFVLGDHGERTCGRILLWVSFPYFTTLYTRVTSVPKERRRIL
jgi:hypothetical protein